MSLFAALILSAQAAPVELLPVVRLDQMTVTAGVRVLRTTRIDLEALVALETDAVQVSRDDAGTIWIDFP